MKLLVKKGRHPKKYAYGLFREEMGLELSYVDINELSAKTGIPYMRLWRLIRGRYDWKADDFIKVCVALNRIDILNKIISEVKNELPNLDVAVTADKLGEDYHKYIRERG